MDLSSAALRLRGVKVAQVVAGKLVHSTITHHALAIPPDATVVIPCANSDDISVGMERLRSPAAGFLVASGDLLQAPVSRYHSHRRSSASSVCIVHKPTGRISLLYIENSVSLATT